VSLGERVEPLEDVEAWLDDMALDDNGTPRGEVMEPFPFMTSWF
jgi:hypothetical protein